ncbi:hypothetical protein AU184_17725 [Mycolicibacterium novocastrense]|uniref:hypothetical protein n=1 Tax=Mycobacteriaceae TaxID=1762 RepID=UPI0007485A2C|nr:MULTISPECIES: hypothetical protein [Mycobacteriaceae]KUH64810.1 hypothetical protein AU183_14245 [Mycolicibacterium novocastrense]KUH67275.1 hypothetical protein AU072_24055 [Mycolicibacterium novocastrense]KUH67323.1 hypothetical protein AU184_17725 [Mycolicibacterium novocastrense]OBF88373.1 hypothetical protein A5790_24120 [Mycobacterium sp. 852002-51152_SCH6134967]
MSMGWAPVAFDAAGDWQLWLALTGVLVLCWGLVVVATATLFGAAGGRQSRRVVTSDRGVRGDKPGQDESRQGRAGHG